MTGALTTGLRRSILPAIVTIAFIIAIVSNPAFNPDRLAGSLASANYGWVVPAALTFFAGIWLRAIRWQLLLRSVGLVPVLTCYNVLLIGFMANNVLPFRAGELVRAQALHTQAGVSRTATLATILVERIFDALTLLLFIAAVSLVVPLSDLFGVVLRGGATLFLAGFAVLLVLAFGGSSIDGLLHRLARRLPGRIGDRGADLIGLVLRGIAPIRHPGVLLAVALTSIGAWLIEALVFLMLFPAFGIDQPAYVAVLVTAMSTLATTVPSTQGGIGPFEFAAIQTLAAFGVDDIHATAYAIVSHATVLLPVIPVGIVLLWYGNRQARAAKQTPLV